jgi:hypothetical protein
MDPGSGAGVTVEVVKRAGGYPQPTHHLLRHPGRSAGTHTHDDPPARRHIPHRRGYGPRLWAGVTVEGVMRAGGYPQPNHHLPRHPGRIAGPINSKTLKRCATRVIVAVMDPGSGAGVTVEVVKRAGGYSQPNHHLPRHPGRSAGIHKHGTHPVGRHTRHCRGYGPRLWGRGDGGGFDEGPRISSTQPPPPPSSRPKRRDP